MPTKISTFPPEVRARVVPWYTQDQLTLEQVAARLTQHGHPVSLNAVRNYLIAMRVPLRRRTSSFKGQIHRKDTPVREIADLRAYGFPVVELAAIYDVTDVTIYNRLQAARNSE